jgi:hypothetical protein
LLHLAPHSAGYDYREFVRAAHLLEALDKLIPRRVVATKCVAV